MQRGEGDAQSDHSPVSIPSIHTLQPAKGVEGWACPSCGASAPIARPRHFSPTNYASACLRCNGVGSLIEPQPDKLILHPEKPLCTGAMYSPGFFPNGYLCQPLNHGYYMVRALAERYGFDIETTPWSEMSPEAQQAFLYGDPEPLEVTWTGRSGVERTGWERYPGFYGLIRDWDVGGTYTKTVPCPDCRGARLRPEYLAVRLGGFDVHQLSQMPLWELEGVIRSLHVPERAGRCCRAAWRRCSAGSAFSFRLGWATCTWTAWQGRSQPVKCSGSGWPPCSAPA
jgi:excinuclease ABC subunit A